MTWLTFLEVFCQNWKELLNFDRFHHFSFKSVMINEPPRGKTNNVVSEQV